MNSQHKEWLHSNPWYEPIQAHREQEERAGVKMFLGFPDRWYDAHKFRCGNDHVSTCLLRSELKGPLCLECGGQVRLTFPEDKDGPCEWPTGTSPADGATPEQNPG